MIIYQILEKVFGPMIKFLLILGSATEYILVHLYHVGSMICIGFSFSICIADITIGTCNNSFLFFL